VTLAGGAALAALLVAACQYSYNNPAERLQAGQVSGRAVADLTVGGTIQPAPGVSVSLKGSAFDQVTHDTGRFNIIPLPVGRHTLLFRKGTEHSLMRNVSVELGRDGQPEGVSLGDVEIPFGVSVRGRIVGAEDIVGGGGTALDETTGVTVAAPGTFELDALGLGAHVLKFGLVSFGGAAEWVGGPIVVRLDPPDQSSVVALADVVVRPATSATGHVRFRLVSLHAALAPGDMVVTVTEQVRGVVAPASLPAPDAQGWIEADLPEGIYQVAIAPPAPLVGAVLEPQPATAIVISGEVADLGSLYLVAPEVRSAAQLLCTTGDDCGKGGVCSAGSCPSSWSPAPAAPATLPLCPGPYDCGSGDRCQDATGRAGFCVATAGTTYSSCLGCGLGACTADGITTTQPSPLCP
jgi:hypothetical protein